MWTNSDHTNCIKEYRLTQACPTKLLAFVFFFFVYPLINSTSYSRAPSDKRSLPALDRTWDLAVSSQPRTTLLHRSSGTSCASNWTSLCWKTSLAKNPLVLVHLLKLQLCCLDSSIKLQAYIIGKFSLPHLLGSTTYKKIVKGLPL